MSIPQPRPGERGYAVNPATGMIHLRYADHARGLERVATEAGVLTVLAGVEPKVCRRCFPHGSKRTPNVEAPSSGQARRLPDA